MTMSKSDTSPDVTNHFSALMRQPAAVRSAVPAIPPGVGAGAALGDGVGVGPLPGQRRLQVALDLLGRPEGEHVVAAAHVPPDAVGVAAQLLLHEHLLERRPALAADLDGVVPAGEPKLARAGRDGLRLLGRERAAVSLGLELERDERLVDEARRALAKVGLGWGQGLHGRVTLPEPPIGACRPGSTARSPRCARRGHGSSQYGCPTADPSVRSAAPRRVAAAPRTSNRRHRRPA